MSISVLLIGFCSDNFFRKEGTSGAYGATIKDYKIQQNIDIAIFGTSHALNAYDPRIIEMELGLSTFNLACTSQTLKSTQAVAEMIVNDHDLKLVILDLFSTSVWPSINERGKSLQLNTLDYVPFSAAKSKVIFDMFNINEMPYAFSETLRYHETWPNKTKQSSVDTYYVWNSIDSYNGYRNSNLIIQDADWKEFLKVYKEKRSKGEVPTELTEGEKKRTLEIIDIFKKRDIPILVVNAPSYLKDEYPVEGAYAKLLSEFLKKQGLTYLNFNELWEELDLNKMYFKDPNHLNIRGSIATSAYLARYIKDSFTYKSNVEIPNKKHNRYVHLATNFENTLFTKQMDSIEKEGLYGINSANLYQVSEGRLEILFTVASDTIKQQPLRLDFYISEEEKNKYPNKSIVYDNGKASIYGEFKTENIINFEGVNFIPYIFNYPFKEIKKMEFYAGNQRRIKVFTVENLNIENK